MKAEVVDFQKHSCEEFPGKEITINGVRYEIGKYIGMGGSKISYELINIKAGISHHIIKIYFGPVDEAIEAAKYETEWAAKHKVLGPSSAVQTPCTFRVMSNGGVFLVQEYVINTPHRALPSPIQELSAQSDDQLRKDPLKAIELLEKQRLLRPHDTIVLNNLAACFGVKEDWEKAFECQRMVLNIEPHYCPFSYHFIRICGEMQLFASALHENSRLKTLYPHPHDCDEEVVRILLSSGNPEGAQELLDEMTYESSEKRAQLQQAIDQNKEAKERTRNVYEVVFNLIRTGKREPCLELIEDAIQIYPQDYLLLANYAFFLRINKKHQVAAELLFWILKRAFETPFYASILANGIYCHLMADDPKRAVSFFESLYHVVTTTNAQRLVTKPWDFPGLAIFALHDGLILEESPSTTISILRRAVPYVNRDQASYLEYFCERLRVAHNVTSSGRVPRMLFQD